MSIQHNIENHILTVEIARQEKRNALDAAALEALTEVFTQAAQNDDVRVVFLHAQPGIFCAGGDLSEQLKNPSAEPDTPTGRMIEALSACTKPVIACVEGPAVGLAVTMLYYCDMVYAGSRALFSLPFTALGLTPRYGASLLTLMNAGYHKAAEKILLSEPITATEALDMR
ncbi:MAG: enoyl-CoA hydratase-related protein, partial [Sutterellaceae bacterium]|nr:enoyl-CoA hydratase-related protein [Sutterellaceae bacterium]